MENEIKELQPTIDHYRAALHELLGFIAGCNLLDQDKEQAYHLPMVKFVTTPQWSFHKSSGVSSGEQNENNNT